MSDDVEQFKTSDIQLASFLVTIGHGLVGVEGPRGRRVFVFGAVPDEDRFGYFRDARLVSPRKLFNSYRDLKNVLFEAV